MKYIPGFEFTVGNIVRQGGSLIEQRNKANSLSNDKDFVKGQKYKIYHIQPLGEKVEYVFLTNDARNNRIKLTIEFRNIKEADERISKIMGV